MILLMVKFIWMMFEFFAIARKHIFRSWSKLQRFKITTSFLILSNVNGQSKTDWLGYWLTPIGFKPWQQFDAIQHLQPPTNYTQFHNYRGSHLFQRHVSPLVAHSCTFNCHDQFKNITYMNCSMPFTKYRLLWHETLIAYPLPFHVSTQVSDYQLGLVIMQHGTPVAFILASSLQLNRIILLWRKIFFPLWKALKHFIQCCLAVMNSSLQPYFPYFYYPLGSCTGASFSLFGRIPSSLPLNSRILKHTRSCLSKASSS